MSRFDALEQRFETLQPRERLLLSGVAGVLLVAAFYVLWIEPQAKAGRAAREELGNLQTQVEGLREAVGRFEAELARDPDHARREALERLRAETAALDAALVADGQRVITPQRMVGLLRDMLGRDQRLRVVAINALPPEILRPTAAAAPPAASANGPPDAAASPALPLLHRHRVELRFEGSYAATLDYVRALQALPYRLRLQRLDIDASRWPVLQIEVEVETLSLGEGWIGV